MVVDAVHQLDCGEQGDRLGFRCDTAPLLLGSLRLAMGKGSPVAIFAMEDAQAKVRGGFAKIIPQDFETVRYCRAARVVAGDSPREVELDAWEDYVSLPLPAIAVDAPGRSRILYAIPSDRNYRDDYAAGIRLAVANSQRWILEQLGGMTFAVDDHPEPCFMEKPSRHYAERDSWQRVLDGARRCAPISGWSLDTAWVVYADVEALCGAPGGGLGRGGPALTMMGRADLEGLIGNNAPTYRNECGHGPWPGGVGRWIGGFTHEFGHALGLRHPPGCDEGLPSCDRGAVMDLGYASFPDAHLRLEEKAFLRSRSPFIGPVRGVAQESRIARAPWFLNLISKRSN